jgi:hypothetical protein
MASLDTNTQMSKMMEDFNPENLQVAVQGVTNAMGKENAEVFMKLMCLCSERWTVAGSAALFMSEICVAEMLEDCPTWAPKDIDFWVDHSNEADKLIEALRTAANVQETSFFMKSVIASLAVGEYTFLRDENSRKINTWTGVAKSPNVQVQILTQRSPCTRSDVQFTKLPLEKLADIQDEIDSAQRPACECYKKNSACDRCLPIDPTADLNKLGDYGYCLNWVQDNPHSLFDMSVCSVSVRRDDSGSVLFDQRRDTTSKLVYIRPQAMWQRRRNGSDVLPRPNWLEKLRTRMQKYKERGYGPFLHPGRYTVAFPDRTIIMRAPNELIDLVKEINNNKRARE